MVQNLPVGIGEEIKQLEVRMKVFQNIINVARSNRDNEEFVNRTIADHERKIQWHQQQILTLQKTRNNADQIIEDAKQNLQRLRKTLNTLAHKRDIEKLTKLVEQMQQLGGHILDSEESQEESDDQDDQETDNFAVSEIDKFEGAVCNRME